MLNKKWQHHSVRLELEAGDICFDYLAEPSISPLPGYEVSGCKWGSWHIVSVVNYQESHSDLIYRRLLIEKDE